MFQPIQPKALLIVMMLLLVFPARAQQVTGSITGRVVSDDGQPLRRVAVMVLASGSDVSKVMAGLHRQMTDAEGRFEADGLAPAAYQIIALAPGYVMDVPNDPLRIPVYRVGDTPLILMRKGGVVTGRVTDAAGNPLTGVNVSAVETQDTQLVGGWEALTFGRQQSSTNRQTDDRGQYRLYGLKPGKYVIVANASPLMRSEVSPFAAMPPTYHPSATRDAATVITVAGGSESSGVDIRFRGGVGFAVSGTLKGLSSGEGLVSSATTVQLKQADSDNIIAATVVLPLAGNNAFAFYGVPNGEYEVFARQVMLKDQSQSGSVPQKFVVKNADVTGLTLSVSAMSSVAGKLVLDSATQCKDARLSELDEVTLSIERVPAQAKQPGLRAALGEVAQSFPDEQGVFKFTGLVAGNYWLQPNLPDTHWYLKSQTATTPGAVSPANGLALKAGAKLNNLTVTLAPNGAQLQGRVNSRTSTQIFLIPAEPEAQNNVLRFAETVAASDGAFSFTNLAPGKYLFVTRQSAKSDGPARQPMAWDATERAKLIKEAVAANQMVELKACQAVKSYELKLN